MEFNRLHRYQSTKFCYLSVGAIIENQVVKNSQINVQGNTHDSKCFEDRKACLEAGMNEHIGKPIDIPQLKSDPTNC